MAPGRWQHKWTKGDWANWNAIQMGATEVAKTDTTEVAKTDTTEKAKPATTK